MIIIKRPRSSGKTTILLHYMIINPDTIYVARKEDDAKRAFRLSQDLGLKIDENSFKSMTNLSRIPHDIKILIDDIDCIVRHHPLSGFKLAERAYIVTVSEGYNASTTKA